MFESGFRNQINIRRITKKFNFNRIVKVASCFSVIVMILAASLTLPANAATWTTLIPAEYIQEIFYEGNIRNVRYNFHRNPLISPYGYTASYGSATVNPSPDMTNQQFSVYPLGYNMPSGPPLGYNSSAVAIDVTDFMDDALINVKSSLYLEMDVSYFAYEQYLNEGYMLTVSWQFMGYNSSGNYLGTQDRLDCTYTGRLQDVTVGNKTTIEIPISLLFSRIEFHEPAAYVVPVCGVRYDVFDNEVNLSVNGLTLSCGEFTITTQIDMLAENGLTMEAIEDQLGDLNDKADTIINGSQHQQNQAQDGSEKVEQNQQTMDDVLSALDDYEKIDTTTAMQAIQHFLSEDGWHDVREILSPVIDWAPTVTIMLIVLSLINLSIILFGR